MSVIKYFQFINQIRWANILKLFLISALYSYKGYSYEKKACSINKIKILQIK